MWFCTKPAFSMLKKFGEPPKTGNWESADQSDTAQGQKANFSGVKRAVLPGIAGAGFGAFRVAAELEEGIVQDIQASRRGQGTAGGEELLLLPGESRIGDILGKSQEPIDGDIQGTGEGNQSRDGGQILIVLQLAEVAGVQALPVCDVLQGQAEGLAAGADPAAYGVRHLAAHRGSGAGAGYEIVQGNIQALGHEE